MSLAGRSLVTMDDLSNDEVEGVFSLADGMADSLGEQSSVCQGKIMASLFFEPSTRTRMSFEAAMLRLGGRVITAVDIGATSLAKGESIADMARVVGSYADIIVIRHPWEGSAKVVADYAGVPVINAGDGGHEHPTQTLLDLYTIKKERKTIKGLKVALWGDLKYGRTVHSLAYALARFGATILFRPAPGLGIPDHVVRKLTAEYGGELRRYGTADQSETGGLFSLDAIYVTPSTPHQLAMMADVSLQVELEKGVDAIYVTRLQRERRDAAKVEGDTRREYPVVDKRLLRERTFKETLVMHPLPRVDELAYELDADPRSMYFKQAARGVPVRMALISLLLGSKKADTGRDDRSRKPGTSHPAYNRGFGVRCQNRNCVSVNEEKYIKPEFKIISLKPLTLRCIYCEHETFPKYVASAEWHEGTLKSKRYHSSDSHWMKKIRPENLIIFDSESEAQSRGFLPGKYAEG
ncbi:MAG: aspartate carbamoyltransferase catalytic subunit [Dehalococcoidia bacterium]|nr:aspartate carbamoyltransferase catalytic subunit [Dehalococcoidia bacterium]